MDFLYSIFGYIMYSCYTILGNYGLAIILFTLFTKIVLIPVSVWVHNNSLRMLKIQPQINRIKARYFGDNDRVAEEQGRLFKDVKYNPFASIVPLFVQIALLLIVINVIYRPLSYLLRIPTDIISLLTTELIGADITYNSPTVEMQIIAAAKNSELAANLAAVTDITPIVNFNTDFLSFNLTATPIDVLGFTLVVPIIAGLSSLFLSFVQNNANAFQADQSPFLKWFTMLFSVGLSLYLGLFVPIGVALYWVVGNLLAIVQLYTLNIVIKPEKHVDMAELAASKAELSAMQSIGGRKKSIFANDEKTRREKADYKRFFSIANKKLVFYSESSGFYKYFEGVIEQLLAMSNISIHYITSDANDKIFEKAQQEPRIKPYYIGERRLITLMMKMDADMVVMTMTDLQNFHIKRSLVRDDIEYVYMFHAPLSYIMTINYGAIDHYDTIFCTGKHHVAEVRESEKLYGLKPKKIVEAGYSLIDSMSLHYNTNRASYQNDVKKVLIAPSWQPDNILDSCLDEMINALLGTAVQVIVRPHPEYVKRYGERMNAIIEKYKDTPQEKLIIQTDFSSNDTVYAADILITDWSGVAYEYSLATLKPSIFVNTEMKVANPRWEELDIEPVYLTLRNKIGVELNKDKVVDINRSVEEILDNYNIYEKEIEKMRDELLFNFGKSKRIEAEYILNSLKNRGNR